MRLQRSVRARGEYSPPGDLLGDVEAPPLGYVAEREQTPSAETSAPFPEAEVAIQVRPFRG